jgi:oligopeptidase B
MPHLPRVAAAKKPTSFTHHGITVTDDYAWLRDPGYPEVTDKEVLAHLEAENAWFEARMAAASR